MPNKNMNCAEQAVAYRTLLDAAEKFKSCLAMIKTDDNVSRLAMSEKKRFNKAYSVILLRRKAALEKYLDFVMRRGRELGMSIVTDVYMEGNVKALSEIEKKLISLGVNEEEFN
jgi:hypothetical protein